VLILLRSGAKDVEVLLIERAVRANDPASGQVGLPGGRASDGDPDLAFTALREAQEEVGVSSADLAGPPRFFGFRDASVFSLRVGVFAAELGPSGRSPSAYDRGEVAHVFWLPRSALRTTRKVRQDTSRGALEVDAVVLDGHVLWGFTRRVLLDFFGIAPGNEA
jgi:8-oxo-dGTP pyrophosphatase MutT (NUDIX family)